jgi:multidrug efflux pump subunit AcrA (membrane-fusion protein)
VKSVAVLPENSSYSDTKTYSTVVEIDEEVYQLKPGMTAVCDIKIDYLSDATAVPVQAIVQRSGENWLFIEESGRVQRRKVELGLSNDRYVSVVDGVDFGDAVILNPGSLIDDKQSETEVAKKPGSGNDIPDLVAEGGNEVASLK